MPSEPVPLELRHLGHWLRVTRRLDDRFYRRRARPLRAGRVLRSLWPAPRRPLFVVGAPRSGTSFLGDACGRLPEFSYHYEPPISKAAARAVHERRLGPRRAALLYRLTYAWLAGRHLDGDLRFAEKTPQNCFAVHALARAFPDAQFVHIVRDGRDAALSWRDREWLSERARDSGKRETGGYPMGPYARFWVEAERRDEFEATSDLHRCIWAWRRHVEAALEHGAALPADRWHEVRYEELVARPARVGGLLLDFLRIEDAVSRETLLAALAAADGKSVGRWRHELEPAEHRLVEREAGALLERLGYALPAAEQA